MKMLFEVDCKHFGELREQFDEFFRAIDGKVLCSQSIPAAVVARECDPTPEVASEKKPVGRPRKAVEATAAEPAPAPKAEKPKKYTLDQVRSALQTYAQKVDPDTSVGILKVRELLAQYQSTKGVPCQKISEVQDQDYAALVAACGV